MKNKVIQTPIYIFINIGISYVCRLGHCTTLQNGRFDTQYVGIIEEQKQQIKQLQEELAEFNRVRYRTLPANASRGRIQRVGVSGGMIKEVCVR
jgi:hypothetical protein